MVYCDGPRPGSTVRVSREEFKRVTEIDNRVEMLAGGVGNFMGRVEEIRTLTAERAAITADKPIQSPK